MQGLYNDAQYMRGFWRHFRGALRRVFPDCLTQAQASAFGMFLSFFPLLLFFLGLLGTSKMLAGAAQELVAGLRAVIPPGSRQTVTDFLIGSGGKSLELTLLGLGGTLLAGTQVMTGLMEGFRIVYRRSFQERLPFWRQQARAFLLLCLTVLPWLLAVVLTVFGRQLREWMVGHFGLPRMFGFFWAIVYASLALVVATLNLVVLYSLGQRERQDWDEVLPGAVVATLLWWVVNTGFGFYVAHMPYSVVYGGLAAAIGLLIWMNLTATVVLIGAAFNAERAARVATPPPAPPAPEEAEPAPTTTSAT